MTWTAASEWQLGLFFLTGLEVIAGGFRCGEAARTPSVGLGLLLGTDRCPSRRSSYSLACEEWESCSPLFTSSPSYLSTNFSPIDCRQVFPVFRVLGSC